MRPSGEQPVQGNHDCREQNFTLHLRPFLVAKEQTIKKFSGIFVETVDQAVMREVLRQQSIVGIGHRLEQDVEHSLLLLVGHRSLAHIYATV